MTNTKKTQKIPRKSGGDRQSRGAACAEEMPNIAGVRRLAGLDEAETASRGERHDRAGEQQRPLPGRAPQRRERGHRDDRHHDERRCPAITSARVVERVARGDGLRRCPVGGGDQGVAVPGRREGGRGADRGEHEQRERPEVAAALAQRPAGAPARCRPGGRGRLPGLAVRSRLDARARAPRPPCTRAQPSRLTTRPVPSDAPPETTSPRSARNSPNVTALSPSPNSAPSLAALLGRGDAERDERRGHRPADHVAQVRDDLIPLGQQALPALRRRGTARPGRAPRRGRAVPRRRAARSAAARGRRHASHGRAGHAACGPPSVGPGPPPPAWTSAAALARSLRGTAVIVPGTSIVANRAQACSPAVAGSPASGRPARRTARQRPRCRKTAFPVRFHTSRRDAR